MAIRIEDLREGDRVAPMGAVREIIWRDDIDKFSVWFAGDGWYNFEPGHTFPCIWRNGVRWKWMPEDRPERRHPGARV